MKTDPGLVVLDTNVVVSAFLKAGSPPETVLLLALNGRIRPCLTEVVLAEYLAVLARPKFAALDRAAVAAVLEDLEKIALLVTPHRALSEATADPADAKFLECAVECRAGFLVTGNTRHFSAEFEGTRIVTPAEFLRVWFGGEAGGTP